MNKKKLFCVFCVSVIFIGCAARLNPGPEDKAQVTADDGVILVGKYVPPKSPDKLVFVMLHGLDSWKGEWYPFAEKLAQQGHGYFSYDLRGHGESIVDKNGNKINFRNFGQPGPGSDWDKMVNDLACVVKYVQRKGIKKNHIGIMGASLGANIALLYSVKHKFVPMTVLLSPGIEYAGLNIQDAIKEYGQRPIAVAASPDDKFAYESSGVMVSVARQYKTTIDFFYGTANRHGVQMFQDPQFGDKLLTWVETNTKKMIE